jgi:hypothetical protein
MSPLAEATLDAFRQVGDPIADRVAGAFGSPQALKSGDWGAVNASLRRLDRNDSPIPGDLSAVVRDYLGATYRMPRWADAALLARAQELFARHGPWIMVALHCASLPYSYSAAKGVKVLHFTGQLGRSTWRRLLTTAQFVVDVMAPGAFAPEGHALRSAQKVRLVHAAVRHDLAARPGGTRAGVSRSTRRTSRGRSSRSRGW